MGKQLENIKEWSYKITQFLNENLRKIIVIKIIDNLLVYSFYLLIILSGVLAIFQLIKEIVNAFSNKLLVRNEYPLILDISEHIFLYFLPVFILYGLLAFYQRGLSKFTDTFELQPPNKFEESEVALRLSKKLFFTSVLSYITLKVVELLFFKFNEIRSQWQLLGIGIFIVLLIIAINLHSQRRTKQ